jgi:TRAP-type C4-dicarboxylate transport system substrate-binding protein
MRSRMRSLLKGTLLLAVLMSLTAFSAPFGNAEEKATVLKFGTWMPERHATSAQSRWWAEQLAKKTNNRVKIQFFYSGALGSSKDQLDNLKYGTFDVGPAMPWYDPAKTPLWTILTIPWVNSMNPWVRMMTVMDLAELPEMKQELAKWGTTFLFPYALGDLYSLWTVKKPVRTFEDLKGLKIRSVGQMAKSLSIIGASPQGLPMPEVYDALAKGVIDGGCLAAASAMGWKVYEICKYENKMKLGMGGPIWLIRKAAYEKLPADIQKSIDEVSLEMARHMADADAEFQKKFDEKLKEAGVEVIEFPESEQEKYEQIAVMPVVESWIKEMEGKGLPGRKVWNTMKEATAKYAKMAK